MAQAHYNLRWVKLSHPWTKNWKPVKPEHIPSITPYARDFAPGFEITPNLLHERYVPSSSDNLFSPESYLEAPTVEGMRYVGDGQQGEITPAPVLGFSSQNSSSSSSHESGAAATSSRGAALMSEARRPPSLSKMNLNELTHYAKKLNAAGYDINTSLPMKKMREQIREALGIEKRGKSSKSAH